MFVLLFSFLKKFLLFTRTLEKKLTTTTKINIKC